MQGSLVQALNTVRNQAVANGILRGSGRGGVVATLADLQMAEDDRTRVLPPRDTGLGEILKLLKNLERDDKTAHDRTYGVAPTRTGYAVLVDRPTEATIIAAINPARALAAGVGIGIKVNAHWAVAGLPTWVDTNELGARLARAGPEWAGWITRFRRRLRNEEGDLTSTVVAGAEEPPLSRGWVCGVASARYRRPTPSRRARRSPTRITPWARTSTSAPTRARRKLMAEKRTDAQVKKTVTGPVAKLVR